MAEAKQKKHATVGNPTVNAVLKSLFRFANEQQALDRLQQIKEHFVTSKHSAAAESAHSAIIWVRGFDVTENEKSQGYTGNYALIACKQLGDKFTLSATKLESELKFHPQRKRPKQKHPDWGHPILRGIKKKRVFASAREAAQELQRLHEEFPEVSIPDESRLMIILYEKVEGVKSPVQKYKFEIRAIPEGGYFIDYKRNIKVTPPKISNQTGPVTNSGYFTQMVKLKRKRKPAKKEE